MYPLLKWNVVLVKQYKEAYVYNLKEKEKGIAVSSAFSYEVINRAASDILELCNGERSIREISKIISTQYSEESQKARTIVDEFLEKSVKKGYIELRKYSKKEKIKILGNNNSYTPLHAEIEITKACPLHCKHCYNNSGELRSEELDTLEILRIMEELKQAGVIKIAITGGEPTIKKGFADLCKYASDSFMAVVIMSNGYMINEEMVKDIEECKYNVTFQISLDGTEKHHNEIRGKNDSFMKACQAVKLLSEKGFIVSIASTFNNKNVDDIEYVTNLSRQLGAVQITYGLTMDVGRASDNRLANTIKLEEFYQKVLDMKKKYSTSNFYINVSDDLEKKQIEKKQINCGLGIGQIVIRENGDVSPCACFFYSIGNLKKNKLSEILTKEFGETIKKLSMPNIENCKYCDKKEKCTQCLANLYDSEYTKDNCKWRDENLEVLNKLEKFLKPL